ncbi:hypothetical protein CJ030_MR5G015902 [Morella rubra]|uniref:PGG domain-containing protein n=1 Tax=Morella rubra TaxID=262757 RepID=A0A6A1VQT1_9ROSI|nr:hypothetical protein CJ030_MR5G015902 [Morella rubra]
MITLQIAAHRGNNSIMERIISRCPDCCELVENRGWNVLHFAIDGRGVKDTVGVILKYSSLSNFDGNTPFHHQSNYKDIEENLMAHPRVDKMAFNKLNLASRDISLLGAKSPRKEARRVIKDEGEIEEAMDALQRVKDAMLEETEKAKKMEEEAEEKESKDYTEKAARVHLVVAAIITTVTFIAGITIPWGF